MIEKLKNGLKELGNRLGHWFRRCNGADNLGTCIVFTALVAVILSRLLRSGLLALVGMGLYIWAMFRMLSHNVAKRREENRRFTQGWARLKTEARQFFVRLKNIRRYKYFRCPNCKARLKMPRGVGEKTVTCSRCKNSFQQKA